MQTDSDPEPSIRGGRPSVLVVGSANMDLVVTCDRFPAPGETILGRGFGMYPGGKGANQAVACSRLGAEVHFLGKMGDDLFRDQLVRSLSDNGVLIERLKTAPDLPTGIATITVDGSGQNEIVVASGSNMALQPEDVEAERDLFSRVDAVLLQLEIPVETVVRAAELGKEGGATVILNPAPAAPLPDRLLRRVDLLTPNESEAGLLVGVEVKDVDSAVDAARRLVARGVAGVVLTMGERGSLRVTSEGSRVFPACKVDAIDTTAAGDAFNGALAFSIASGRSLDEAIQYAGVAGAYAVTKRGAQPSMPTRGDLEGFMAEAGVAIEAQEAT